MWRDAHGWQRLVLLWSLALVGLGLAACEPGAAETAAVPVATSAVTPTVPPTPTGTVRGPRTSPTPTGPTATPTRAVRGDYGDAPDGHPAGYGNTRVVGRFPTSLGTHNSEGPGAHVRNPGSDRLGRRVTRESDADDPNDDDGVPNLVNADAGDDGVQGLTVLLGKPPLQARLSLEITLAATAPAGPRFVNVLIDMNRDGRWSGAPDGVPEWAVRNWRIMAPPGLTTLFESDPFLIGNETQLPDGAWMRVLLTREAIAGNVWDGSGGWAYGEVEDYQVALPRGAGAGLGAEPQAVPVLICPPEVSLEQAVLVAGLTCTVVNLGGDGMLEARFVRASGTSQLLPSRVSLQTLRGGAQHVLTFALVRGEPPGQWRYRTQSQEIGSVAEGGVVTVGIGYADRTINAQARNPMEVVFRTDGEADAFSLATRATVTGYGFADIHRVAVGTARLDTAVLDVLRRELFALGSSAPGRVAEAFVAVIVEMGERIPLTESSLGFLVGIAFEANDDPADNWRPQVGSFDLFQDTDQWYEIIYRPDLDPAWRLQRRDAAEPRLAVASDAVAFVLGSRLLVLIPSSEFERVSGELRYRVTTFVHQRDDPTGTEKPSMADTYPELHQPLEASSSTPVPRG